MSLNKANMEVRSEGNIPDISNCLTVNLEEVRTPQTHTAQTHMAQTHTPQQPHTTQAYPSQTQVEKTHTTAKEKNDMDIEGYFRVMGKHVQCLECQKAMRRTDMRTHHDMHLEEKPFECETCFKRFTRSDKLVTHKKIHSGERPYQCFCTKRFLRLDHLKTHVATHNLSIEDSQALIDQAQMKEGSKILLPRGEFLVCPFCTRKFAQSYKYNRHLRLHTGEKPYHCCCGAKYARSERLHRHLLAYPDHWQSDKTEKSEKAAEKTQEKTGGSLNKSSDNLAPPQALPTYQNSAGNTRSELFSPAQWQEGILASEQSKTASPCVPCDPSCAPCIPSVSNSYPLLPNPTVDLSASPLWPKDKLTEYMPGLSDNFTPLASSGVEGFVQNTISDASCADLSGNYPAQAPSSEAVVLSDNLSDNLGTGPKQTISDYAELLKSRLPPDTEIRIKKRSEQCSSYPLDQTPVAMEILGPENSMGEEGEEGKPRGEGEGEEGKSRGEGEVEGGMEGCLVKEEIKREVEGEEEVEKVEEGKEGER